MLSYILWTQNYTSPLAPQVPNEYRPLTIREICLFPRFPQTMPYHMTYYGVNALELTTQIPDFKWVNMEELFFDYHKNNHSKFNLWTFFELWFQGCDKSWKHSSTLARKFSSSQKALASSVFPAGSRLFPKNRICHKSRS